MFRDWVRAHRVLAAAALLVAAPNVELLTLMSCHATPALDLLWLDSPMAERKLASLGYLSLLQNVPQVCVPLPCRHTRPRGSGVKWGCSTICFSLAGDMTTAGDPGGGQYEAPAMERGVRLLADGHLRVADVHSHHPLLARLVLVRLPNLPSSPNPLLRQTWTPRTFFGSGERAKSALDKRVASRIGCLGSFQLVPTTLETHQCANSNTWNGRNKKLDQGGLSIHGGWCRKTPLVA